MLQGPDARSTAAAPAVVANAPVVPAPNGGTHHALAGSVLAVPVLSTPEAAVPPPADIVPSVENDGEHQRDQSQLREDIIDLRGFDIHGVLDDLRPVPVRLPSQPAGTPAMPVCASPARVPADVRDASIAIDAPAAKSKRIYDGSFKDGSTFVSRSSAEDYKLDKMAEKMREIQLQRGIAIRLELNGMQECKYVPRTGSAPKSHLAWDGYFITDAFGDKLQCCRECYFKHQQSLLRSLARKK